MITPVRALEEGANKMRLAMYERCVNIVFLVVLSENHIQTY